MMLFKLALRLYGKLFRTLFFVFNHFFRKRVVVPRIDNNTLRLSAVDLARDIRLKKITARSAVETYIQRIKDVNGLLNAVAEDRFNEALQEADEVDTALAKGLEPNEHDAPFLGVPFTVKECIYVTGMTCSAGLASRRECRATEDALVVQRMKAAGGIPLATTNTSEMCAWWECHNYNYGRTHNPYDSRRTPGGSSGGEAALIGAGASILGIGSDGGGSIRMPAYFCGIYGHKPTQGTVSSADMCLLLQGPQNDLHTFGPMCRCVDDLRPSIATMMDKPNVQRCQMDKVVELEDISFFYMDGIDSPIMTPATKDIKDALYKVVNHLETNIGISCIRVALPLMSQAFWIWVNDIGHEDAHPVTHLLKDGKGDFNPVKELLRWLLGKSEHTLPALSFAIMDRIATAAMAAGIVTPERRDLTRQQRDRLQRQVMKVLEGEAVLLFPTQPTVAPFHHLPLVHPVNHGYTAIFNSFGLPVTQVPLGLTKTDGIPVGIQVVGGPKKDYLTISVAEHFEKLFGGWIEPAVVD